MAKKQGLATKGRILPRLTSLRLLLACLLLAANAPSAAADEFRITSVPSGPSLQARAAELFEAWVQAEVPPWFRGQVPFEGTFLWRSQITETVYFESEMKVERESWAQRDDSGCWLVERWRFVGTPFEVRYGSLSMVFSPSDQTRVRLANLYSTVSYLWAHTTMDAVIASSGKTVPQFLAELVDGDFIKSQTLGYFLEAFSIASDLITLANTQEIVSQITDIFASFDADYQLIVPQLGHPVVTTEGGYDAGLWRSLGQGQFGEAETRSAEDCRDEPWRSMELGQSRLLATHIEDMSNPTREALLAEIDSDRPDFDRVAASLREWRSIPIDELTPAGAPSFQDLSIDPNLGLEGNWIINWGDSDEADGYAVLSKGGQLACVGEPCWSQFARDPDAPWGVVFWQPGGGNAGYVDMGAGGTLNVHYFNFHLGTNGGRSVSKATSNSRIEGFWTYPDRDGTESWVRVFSQIRWYEAYSESWDKKSIGEGALEVSTTFLPAGSYMRGQRHSFTIDVYGDELWGRHYPWIDRSTDLEIWSLSYICTPAEGGYITHSDWQVCLNQGGVEGLSIEIIVWPNAAPGLRELYIDGTPILLDLEVDGWPG